MTRRRTLPLLPLLAVLAVTPCAAKPAQRAAVRPAPTAQPRLEWARGAAFYEIFVRSFADSDGDIAIVGLGRKLAGVLFAMWRDGTAFGEKSVTLSRAPAQVA